MLKIALQFTEFSISQFRPGLFIVLTAKSNMPLTVLNGQLSLWWFFCTRVIALPILSENAKKLEATLDFHAE